MISDRPLLQIATKNHEAGASNAVRSQAEPWERGYTYNCTSIISTSRNPFFCATNQIETVYRWKGKTDANAYG